MLSRKSGLWSLVSIVRTGENTSHTMDATLNHSAKQFCLCIVGTRTLVIMVDINWKLLWIIHVLIKVYEDNFSIKSYKPMQVPAQHWSYISCIPKKIEPG
ncbi:hypothetical protein V1477_009910 [Vespula maculifrons]|uniref:Uncharacterized protein n=1 Tax=Vespula maculifrons TaxID=7453 RepID=A0ABD2CB42_VESMC